MKDLTKRKTKQVRHAPLAKQIEDDNVGKKRVRTGKLSQEKDDITEEEYVSNKLSKKILASAHKQIEEVDEDVDEGEEEEKGKKSGPTKKSFKSFEELMAEDDTSTVYSEMSETESMYQDDVTVDEEDERALAMFMNPAAQPKRLLSDIIMEKLAQHEAALKRKDEQKDQPKKEPEIKPEIIGIYVKVGDVLKHFTSGKLPKAFKILPSLRNWEQLLYLTRPDKWTPVVTRMATFLFSRGMTDKLVQRFYYVILLPKIRDEIQEKKKLGFHHYLALKKALYRPAAFFRGILLPLCESGDCTLREATIVGSVMRRVSIPAIHASVAIYKLCQMPYFGATQYFILVLLNKKFSLPYKVIDTVYDYFMNFMNDPRKFPSLWHQTLLVFAQRYKNDLTQEQKQGLQQLTQIHKNATITPEINREIFSAKNRGESSTASATAMTTATTTTTTETAEMDL